MTKPNARDAVIIKSLRRSTGWTQFQLAHQLAISLPMISEIENGKRGISRRVIEILVHKLNVRRDWIETGEGEPFDANNPPPPPGVVRQTKAIATTAPVFKAQEISTAFSGGGDIVELVNKLAKAYGARNHTDLAQRIFKTSQSTVASWIRRNRVPDEIVAKALAETSLTLEELLTDKDYIYIRKVDLVEIIENMSQEVENFRKLKPSEIIRLLEAQLQEHPPNHQVTNQF
jgi:transcriptional regulator with XRE-family HTH domain